MVNKSCDFFVVLGGIARASSVRTAWGFALHSEVVLICLVRCGKCMRPCVVSMTTLYFLIKCNPMIGPVSFLSLRQKVQQMCYLHVKVKCGCR